MATPAPVVVQRQDALTLEEWDTGTRVYRRYDSDVLVVERPFTDDENASVAVQVAETAADVSRADLLAKMRAAYATDQAYLDKIAAGTAVTADHIAQVPVLTRQMMAMMRLFVDAEYLDQ